MKLLKLLFHVLTTLLVMAVFAAPALAEFSLPDGGPAGMANTETPIGFKIKGTAEAEVTCKALQSSAYVMETPGKTGERASEDTPASGVTEKSRQLGVKLEDENCSATILGIKKEATVTPTSCQLELQEHTGENVYTSLRASVAGTPCALTIRSGECEVELPAKSRGENERLEGLRVRTLGSEELEIEESTARKLKARENGKCALGGTLESTLEIKRKLVATQIIVVRPAGVENFGRVQAGRTLTRVVRLNARRALTFEVLNISSESIFKRRSDRCSNLFVAMGNECELEIEFAPLARVPYRATLEAPFTWVVNNMRLRDEERSLLLGEGI